tara:strand:+ start:77 stop:244 length:168 start_codon:yes stop_codon:yes gene_type:complete
MQVMLRVQIQFLIWSLQVAEVVEQVEVAEVEPVVLENQNLHFVLTQLVLPLLQEV